jgi:hypothetical protein
MARIDDGTGQGFSAGVDKTNRLLVNSADTSAELLAAEVGEAFGIGTGTVAFTASVASGILYVQNLSSRPLILDRIRLMLGTATGATGDWTVFFSRNPTAGTTITNALPAGITNINHGSNIVPDAIAYRGVQGDTLTGGTGGNFPIKTAGDGQILFDFGRVLPTGSSFGVILTPPPGTTAANVFGQLRCYYPTNA